MAQLSEHHVRAVVSLAAGIEIKRDMAEFDRHPDLLCCANCVVDLRTGETLDHDPALMFTKTTGVDYVPGATHPDWAKALTALPAEVLPWYQIRIGQGATGYMPPDEALADQHRPGENGKTTVVQGIRHALGDYFVQVPVKALLGDHREHDTVLMPFRGARIAAVEETPDEGRLNMQQLKQITTPQITGPLMRQDYIAYDTTHATMVNTNHEPAVENADHGSLRRVLAVVWPYRYLKPGQPHGAPDRPRGRPGAAGQDHRGRAGPARGCPGLDGRRGRRWYEAGRVMPAVPEQVQADTDAWLDRVNLIFAFGTAHLARGRPPPGHVGRAVPVLPAGPSRTAATAAWSERDLQRRGSASSPRPGGGSSRRRRPGTARTCCPSRRSTSRWTRQSPTRRGTGCVSRTIPTRRYPRKYR